MNLESLVLFNLLPYLLLVILLWVFLRGAGKKNNKTKFDPFKFIVWLLIFAGILMNILSSSAGSVLEFILAVTSVPLLIFLIFFMLPITAALVYRTHSRMAGESETPFEYCEFLTYHGSELESLGFSFSHFSRLSFRILGGDYVSWEAVYHSAEYSTYAYIKVPNLIDKSMLEFIDFYTVFPDGFYLWTVNARTPISKESPNRRVVQTWESSPAGVWKQHLAALEELKNEGRSPLALSPEQMTEFYNEIGAAEIEDLVKKGVIHKVSEENYRFKFFHALGFAFNGISSQGKMHKALSENKDKDWVDRVAPGIEADVFEVQQGMIRTLSFSWIIKIFLFPFSVLLSGQNLGIEFSPVNIGIFLGALLFHDLCCLLGMAIFKVNDNRFLVFSFLKKPSGVQEQNASNWRLPLISLIGVVPGIILGIVSLVLTLGMGMESISILAFTLIAVNYLFMIPFDDFEGKRILDFVFFKKPEMEMIYVIIMGAIFILSFFKSGSTLGLFIGILLILIAVQLQAQGRLLKKRLDGKMGASLDAAPRSELVREAFQAMRDEKFKNMNFVSKIDTLSRLLENITGPSPSFLIRVLIFLIQFLPIAFLLTFMFK